MARKCAYRAASRICPSGDRQCECSKNGFRVFTNHGILWEGNKLYKQKVISLYFVLKINMFWFKKKWTFLLVKKKKNQEFPFSPSLWFKKAYIWIYISNDNKKTYGGHQQHLNHWNISWGARQGSKHNHIKEPWGEENYLHKEEETLETFLYQ